MKRLLFLLFTAFAVACGTQKSSTSGNTSANRPAQKSTEVEYLDDNTFKITVVATDPTYGYKQENPIKVGGTGSGPKNERRFLNGLLGPNGEALEYYRMGSCCMFNTSNGFMGSGMLDKYKVYWEGCKDTAILFINMYDREELKVPVGFTSRSL